MDRRGLGAAVGGIFLTGGLSAIIGATALPEASPYFALLMNGGLVGVIAGLVMLLALFIWQPRKAPNRTLGALLAEQSEHEEIILDGGHIEADQGQQRRAALEEERTGMGGQYVNNGSNFGHMGPINNFGKVRHQLSGADIAQVIAALPPGRQVQVFTIGSAANHADGARLASALSAAGFSVSSATVGIYDPVPTKPITMVESGEGIRVIFAPDA